MKDLRQDGGSLTPLCLISAFAEEDEGRTTAFFSDVGTVDSKIDLLMMVVIDWRMLSTHDFKTCVDKSVHVLKGFLKNTIFWAFKAVIESKLYGSVLYSKWSYHLWGGFCDFFVISRFALQRCIMSNMQTRQRNRKNSSLLERHDRQEPSKGDVIHEWARQISIANGNSNGIFSCDYKWGESTKGLSWPKI